LEENILLQSYCAVYSGQMSDFAIIFVRVCTVLTVVLEVYCALGMPVYSNPLLGSLLLLHEFCHPPLTCLLSDFIKTSFFPILVFFLCLEVFAWSIRDVCRRKEKICNLPTHNLSLEMAPLPRCSLRLLDLPQIIILLSSFMNYCLLMWKRKYDVGGFHDDRDLDCGVLVMTFVVLLVVFQANSPVLQGCIRFLYGVHNHLSEDHSSDR
jgi:hypothetical protein